MRARRPLVSVITPSYNQAAFIETTILSVFGQDYPNLEHVVVDGGSTDGTIDILRKYSDKLRWISEKDRGQCDALNKGFALARGEIFGWLNSDDFYYDEGAVSAAVDFLLENKTTDMVYGDFVVVDENDSIKDVRRSRSYHKSIMYVINFIPQPTIFFRRLLAEKYPLNLMYEITLDTEWLLRIAAEHKIQKINRIQAAFRHHEHSKLKYLGMERYRSETARVRRDYPIRSSTKRFLLQAFSRLQGAYCRLASTWLLRTDMTKWHSSRQIDA